MNLKFPIGVNQIDLKQYSTLLRSMTHITVAQRPFLEGGAKWE
jgi:hypothetical protein